MVDAVSVPVVATGGIAESRGACAALLLGASAVQIGTGFLSTTEAGLAPAWVDGMRASMPEDTTTTRAFSGRLGRSLRTPYTDAANSHSAPKASPYPIQRNLTAAMRTEAVKNNSLDTMQAWAGQSAALSHTGSAKEALEAIWEGMQKTLS